MGFEIKEGLESAGINVSVRKTTEVKDVDYFDCNLICVSSPSPRCLPPKQVNDLCSKNFVIP